MYVNRAQLSLSPTSLIFERILSTLPAKPYLRVPQSQGLKVERAVLFVPQSSCFVVLGSLTSPMTTQSCIYLNQSDAGICVIGQP